MCVYVFMYIYIYVDMVNIYMNIQNMYLSCVSIMWIHLGSSSQHHGTTNAILLFSPCGPVDSQVEKAFLVQKNTRSHLILLC